MHKVVTWIVPPRKRNVTIVNDGIGAFARSSGIPEEDSLRLQVSVEGVFSYLAHNILSAKMNNEIYVEFYWESPNARVVLMHDGPGGEWDDSLRPDSEGIIRRTSFDSMGLFIAHDILHKLTYDSWYDLVRGKNMNKYRLEYTATL